MSFLTLARELPKLDFAGLTGRDISRLAGDLERRPSERQLLERLVLLTGMLVSAQMKTKDGKAFMDNTMSKLVPAFFEKKTAACGHDDCPPHRCLVTGEGSLFGA